MTWIPVTDKLPEHGAHVLVWCGYVQRATFYVSAWTDRSWTREDAIAADLAFNAEHGFDRTREDAEAGIDQNSPNEPHFTWGGGDADTTWRASNGFACDETCYGAQPPITHWMPMPEGPEGPETPA